VDVVIIVQDDNDMTSTSTTAPFRSVPINFEGPNKTTTRDEPIKLYMKSLRSAQMTSKMKFDGEEGHHHHENNDKENGGVESEFEYSEHLRFSTSMTSRQSRLCEINNVRESSLDSSSNYHRGSRASASSSRHQDKRESASSRHQQDKRESASSSHHQAKRESASSRHHRDKREDSNSKASSSRHKKPNSIVDPQNVIAVFGAYGVTGHYFLQRALEAGYHVRALMLPGIGLEDMQGNDNLSLITGTLDDENKIRRVVKNSSFVVCMLTDCENTLQHPPPSSARSSNSPPPATTFDFIKRLCPILEDVGLCQVFLYQVRLLVCLLHTRKEYNNQQLVPD
jgi:hypothetical protein